MWKKGISESGFEKLSQYYHGKRLPEKLTKDDLFDHMLQSAKELVEEQLDLGDSFEEAIAHAKERSTAGPAVWAKIEGMYLGYKNEPYEIVD